MNLLPRYAFFVSGTGSHTDRLQAFDQALLSAGPFAHNLVTVSSILPAKCEIISPEKGFEMLIPGQITFCVMARQENNTLKETASTGVGFAKINDTESFGYISEYHGDLDDSSKAKEEAKKLAIEMLARKLNTTTNNIDINILDATSASITNDQENLWVCSVSLCVFVM